jgi:Bacterial regulatory proteins, luxR family
MTFDKLTARQRRCAELAARGIPNSEIAELIGVKPRTVKAHLSRVFALLSIHSGHKRTKLAALLNQHRVREPLGSTFRIIPKAYSTAALVAQGFRNNEVALLSIPQDTCDDCIRFARRVATLLWDRSMPASLAVRRLIPASSSQFVTVFSRPCPAVQSRSMRAVGGCKAGPTVPGWA